MKEKEDIGFDLIDDKPDYTKTKEENEKEDLKKYNLEEEK